MTSHSVYEPDSVYDNMDAYNVGDTVDYNSNNQEGYMRYVVTMVDGVKKLRAVADIYGPFEDDEELEGGRRRRRKLRKTMKKRGGRAKKRTAHKKRTMRKKMVKRRRAKTLSKRK